MLITIQISSESKLIFLHILHRSTHRPVCSRMFIINIDQRIVRNRLSYTWRYNHSINISQKLSTNLPSLSQEIQFWRIKVIIITLILFCFLYIHNVVVYIHKYYVTIHIYWWKHRALLTRSYPFRLNIYTSVHDYRTCINLFSSYFIMFIENILFLYFCPIYNKIIII